MPSRNDADGLGRRYLLSVGAAAAATLAGCAGASGTGGTDAGIDCATGAGAHGDGNLLNGGARADVEDGRVRFVVTLDVDTLRETGADRIEARLPDGDVAFVIPVSPGDARIVPGGSDDGQLRYEQTLGPRPYHGRYRLVALTPRDEVVDAVTVDVNCFATAD
jgi:hypothetical protein